MILTPLRSMPVLSRMRRKNSELSAGRANVTAIMRQRRDFYRRQQRNPRCNQFKNLRYLCFPLLRFSARQRQSDFACCSTICTTKLFFSAVAEVGDCASPVAGGGDPGRGLPPIDAIAARNSDSRFDGTSTRTLIRPLSGSPFVGEPPNREPIATTSSPT